MKEFLIGSYAPQGENSLFRLKLENTQLKLDCAYSCLGNPSWVSIHPNGSILYAVEEYTPNGKLAVCSMKNDNLSLIAEFSTNGADPCHIEISPDLKYLYVSNYSSGSLAVFTLDENGMPLEMIQLIKHSGHGLDPVRQEAPHIHSARCVNDKIYVCDLGLDKVFSYQHDRATGMLVEVKDSIDFPAGSGPRHTCVNGNVLYIICELSGQIYVWNIKEGRFIACEQCIPENAVPGFTSAAIRIYGSRLYTSTRFTDCIGIFKITENGNISPEGIFPEPFRAPRDIMPLEDYILSADQESHSINLLKRDGNNMVCVSSCALGNARPTCILEI